VNRWVMVVWMVVLGGIGAAACSSGSPSASSTSAPKSPTTASTTTVPSSPTTTAPVTPSTKAGPATCATSALAASVHGSSGAAGTIEMTIALKSLSASPCVLGGYPGLQMLAAGGSQLPTAVVRKGSYGFTAMPPSVETITTGQSVYFNLGYSDVPSGNETSCPVAASLEITPPNSYTSLSLVAQLGPCDGGTITVSPVFAATGSAAQTMA